MPAPRPVMLRLGAPTILLVVIVAADLSSGRAVVYDLLCAVPLLAALLDRPRRVLAWGALCLAMQLLLGFYDQVYDTPDRRLAQGFRLAFTITTTLAATALSARRLRELARTRRVRAAASVAQQAILRPVPPRLGSCRLDAEYRAASRDALVGGDFYDAVQAQDGSVLAVIGDVRGHGLPAVRLAADLLGAFRSFAATGYPTGEILAAMDAIVLTHGGPEDFATATVVKIAEDGNVSALIAGHPPILLHRPTTGRVTALGEGRTEHAPPLGLLLGRLPVPVTDELAVGDRLVLHTDGLSEARDRRGAFFAVDRQIATMGAARRLEHVPDALIGAAQAWAETGLADDAAVLVIEFAPAPSDLAQPSGSGSQQLSMELRGALTQTHLATR